METERVARMSTGAAAPTKAPRTKLFTGSPVSPVESLRRMKASAAVRSHQLMELRLENEALNVQVKRVQKMADERSDSLKKKMREAEQTIIQWQANGRAATETFKQLEMEKSCLASELEEVRRTGDVAREVRDRELLKNGELTVFLQWMEQQLYIAKAERDDARAEIARMKEQKHKKRRK